MTSERLFDQLRDELGPSIVAALGDPEVTGIKVGEDGKLWLKKHVVRWVDTGFVLPFAQRVRVLNLIASLVGKKINEQTPLLSGELPLTGSRVQAEVGPGAEAILVIRRHAPKIFTLDDYVEAGILQQWQADVIREHIKKKSNLVWSGATDSGKTTGVNACLHELKDTTEHIGIIEDTTELQCNAPNVTRLKTGDPYPTMLDQIKASLRLDLDRLVIGETRDQAGYALLKSWTTGYKGGFTTIHADNAVGVLDRFADFAEEAGLKNPPWRTIRRAINLIVHMEMTSAGRRVTELVEVQQDVTEDRIPIELIPLRGSSLREEPRKTWQ